MLKCFDILLIQKLSNIYNDQLNLVIISPPSPINLQYGSLQGANNSTYFYHYGNVSKTPFQNTDFCWNVLPSSKAIMNQSYINCINSMTCEKFFCFSYCSTLVPSLKPKRTNKFSISWNIKIDLLVLHFVMFILYEKLMWGLDLALNEI